MFQLKTFICVLQAWIIVLSFHYSYCLPKYDKKDLENLREEVRQMFQHAYESYLSYAYPYDELRPLSCDGVDTWGSYSLTLIDALDTLAVMGNYTEFQRVVNIVTANANFDANINVSVFETNIRIIGGLLSAHLLSHRAGVNVVPGWPCNGPLLELAEDVARRLIAAFDTPTGMPYGTVNLQHGVPVGETTITCTAGVGTFILELGTLSRLTGDSLFEEVAITALDALYAHRSPLGLVGNHVDVATGRWTAQDAGIGAGVDSYYEYLAKGAILLQRPELMHMFMEGKSAIEKYLKRDDWHLWVSMSKGQVTLPVFQSLEAYWPGVLSLIGDVNKGMKSLHNYHQVWKQYGFTPEFYYIPQGEAGTNRASYPLRPELIESVMYLYRATGDPYLIDVGKDILRSIQHSAKTPCGYATIKDVRDHRKEDRMESFFLAETTKYLYLLFDPENFLHNQGQTGTVVKTPWGECVVDAGGYVFNTEAHPIDPGALHCCSGPRHVEVQENLKVTASINDFKGIPLSLHQKSRRNPTTKVPVGSKHEYFADKLSLTKTESSHHVHGQLDLISKAQIAKLANSMLPAQNILLNSEFKQVDTDASQEGTLEDVSQNLAAEIDGAMDVVHLTEADNDVSQLATKDNDINKRKRTKCVQESDTKESCASKPINSLVDESNIDQEQPLPEECEGGTCKHVGQITRTDHDITENDHKAEDLLKDISFESLPKGLQAKLSKLSMANTNSYTNAFLANKKTIAPYKGSLKNLNLAKLFNDKIFRRRFSDVDAQKVMLLVKQAIDKTQDENGSEDTKQTDSDDVEVDEEETSAQSDSVDDKSEDNMMEDRKSDTLGYCADDSDKIFSCKHPESSELCSKSDKSNANVAHVEGDMADANSPDSTDNCQTSTQATNVLDDVCEQGSGEHELGEQETYISYSFTAKSKFDPQNLFERLQNEDRYKKNSSWLSDHKILSCHSQPFLQRLSVSGEMFEVP